MAGSFRNAKGHRPEGAVSPLLLFPGHFPRKAGQSRCPPMMRLEVAKLGPAVPPDRADSSGTSEQRAGCGEGFLISVQSQIEERLRQRTGIYHKLQRCQPGERMDGLKRATHGTDPGAFHPRRQQVTTARRKLLEQPTEKRRQILLEQKMRRSQYRQSYKTRNGGSNMSVKNKIHLMSIEDLFTTRRSGTTLLERVRKPVAELHPFPSTLCVAELLRRWAHMVASISRWGRISPGHSAPPW